MDYPTSLAGLLSEEARETGALSGLRVLDLTKFWAGPAVTEALGNMGAQVVKVEAAHALDPWRLGGARQTVESSEDGPTYEFSSIFNAVNRNKYGLTLDLSQPRGREILRQLLVTTDLLAENYAPRVMTKFGLGYESLRQINPRLVMISLPAFGSTGPWRDYVGFAYPTEQAAGFPHFTGYTDGEPMLWGCAAGDAIAGMLGLVGVLAAINWARETGEGQHVDVSQVEALSTFLGSSMIDYSWHRRSWPRCGNADPARAPQGATRRSATTPGWSSRPRMMNSGARFAASSTAATGSAEPTWYPWPAAARHAPNSTQGSRSGHRVERPGRPQRNYRAPESRPRQ